MLTMKTVNMVVVVVNLASRLPQFLGSASSAPEGLGGQYGANLVRDEEVLLTKVPPPPSSSVPSTTLNADQSNGAASLVQLKATKLHGFRQLNPTRN